MRVLHITNWYPNVLAPTETPFIERHVNALPDEVQREVWHIEVRRGRPFRLTTTSLCADRSLLLTIPLQRWLPIEWLTTLMVLWAWITRDRSVRHDVINFHIAYPLLSHARLLRWFMRVPWIITEHWSAYHFEFHSTSAGLERIRAIFRKGIPLITVSQALATDIQRFARTTDMRTFTVANVVDTSIFKPAPPVAEREGRFFAIASWRSIKRPDVLIQAVALLRRAGYKVVLRLAGGGADMTPIRQAIREAGVEPYVELLGHLQPAEVAREMREAHALLHASDYETFSVVCAEALCCGIPILASDIPAIREYLEDGMGWFIPTNNAEEWARAIARNWKAALVVDPFKIASHMAHRVSPEAVGKAYLNALQSIRSEAASWKRATMDH